MLGIATVLCSSRLKRLTSQSTAQLWSARFAWRPSTDCSETSRASRNPIQVHLNPVRYVTIRGTNSVSTVLRLSTAARWSRSTSPSIPTSSQRTVEPFLPEIHSPERSFFSATLSIAILCDRSSPRSLPAASARRAAFGCTPTRPPTSRFHGSVYRTPFTSRTGKPNTAIGEIQAACRLCSSNSPNPNSRSSKGSPGNFALRVTAPRVDAFTFAGNHAA